MLWQHLADYMELHTTVSDKTGASLVFFGFLIALYIVILSCTHLAHEEGHLYLVPPLAFLSGRQVHFCLDKEPLSESVPLEVQ